MQRIVLSYVMHTIPKLVIRDDGHCPLFLVPCKYEEPVGGSSLERGPSLQALRQKLWSLSIQAKSGKRNIAPLLSAPPQTTPQTKTQPKTIDCPFTVTEMTY